MALINLRNALMAGKRLPYDAEVEYLESTGTQYIDTGVIAGDDTTFSVRFNCTSTNDTAIYGGRSQSQGRQWILPLQMNQIQFGYGSIYQNINVQYRGNWLNIDTSLSAESYTYKVTTDGGVETLVSTPRQSFTNTAHILLFAAWNNTAVGYKTVAKVAKFQIWKNGVLVRDFIPVRKGTVGYLYDRVSGKLFGNAGTGDFVLGPDVVPVEYIESSGTQYIETGVYGNESTHVTIVAASKAFTSSSDVTDNAQGIFGYAASYSLRVWGKSFHSTYGLLSFGFKQGWTNGSQIYAQSSEQYLTIELRPYGNTSCRMYIDDTASVDSSYGGAFTTSGTLWLGKIGGGNTYNGVNMRIKSFSIEGKCNLVPIRVGSGSTWEGAMMDVLTRRIYRNAGTGAFTFGNDLKYPIPA